MKSNSFTLVNLDTDSIAFCKKDMGKFSKEEYTNLLKDVNSLFPDGIKFAADGEFEVFIVLKSKNYIMYDGEKIKIKGSGLKSATLEPALKDFLMEIINALVFDKMDQLVPIYNKYVKMALDVKDIKPWLKKMTLSETTFNSTRSNETKVIDAIKDSEYGRGDKIYVYPTIDKTLKLADNYSGDHDIEVFLKKLHNTGQRFRTILDTKNVFMNYSLKRNRSVLEELK